MPKNELFKNQEVLNDALKMVKWKSDLAKSIFSKYPKGAKFDDRNLTPLAAMIIDVYDVPENQREAYFTNEVEKIAKAYSTLDADQIKQYIEKMYKDIPTDMDSIDWDNERQVEKLLCSFPLDQCTSTMILDFKKETLELFPNPDDLFNLDAALSKTHYNFLKADAVLREKVDNITDHLNVAAIDLNRCETQVETIIGNTIAAASIKGSDTITIDPTEHELLRDCFLKKQFSVSEVFDVNFNVTADFTDVTCAKTCLYDLTHAYFRAPVEQMVLSEMMSNADDFDQNALLLIDGKPIKDIIENIKKTEDKSPYEATIDASMILRDALTDGKSVVSLMRVGFDKDGNTNFRHQDIKVDLDKLNKANFEERYKKTNFIRRFLHDFGIWKIPDKYASNEARDKAQATTKEKSEFKNALSAAEKNVVDSYNKIDGSRQLDNPNYILNVIPKLRMPNDKIVQREKFPVHDAISTDKDQRKEPKLQPAKTIQASEKQK